MGFILSGYYVIDMGLASPPPKGSATLTHILSISKIDIGKHLNNPIHEQEVIYYE